MKKKIKHLKWDPPKQNAELTAVVKTINKWILVQISGSQEYTCRAFFSRWHRRHSKASSWQAEIPLFLLSASFKLPPSFIPHLQYQCRHLSHSLATSSSRLGLQACLLAVHPLYIQNTKNLQRLKNKIKFLLGFSYSILSYFPLGHRLSPYFGIPVSNTSTAHPPPSSPGPVLCIS